MSTAPSASSSQLPWLVLGTGCALILLTFGPRSTMGFFQLPLVQDTGLTRSQFGLAMAIQNLAWGLSQPVFGALADKKGAGRVLALAGILYAVGLALMSGTDSAMSLYLSGGVLVGAATGAGSFGIVFAAFARRVSAEQRSLAFGLGTAAGSAGMFFFAPLSQIFIDRFGWQDSLLITSAMMLLVPLLAFPLRGRADGDPAAAANLAEFEQTLGDALREALAYRSYRLLMAGFFVCGFQVAFITAHFPAYISDLGIDARYAVLGVSAIGFFNILGSLASGYIGQHYSKPKFLTGIYLARSLVTAVFLLTPPTGATVLTFSVIMGLLWLSTVPPTNALVAIMFGTRYLGMLGGIVFLVHQLGSFLGVWLGGVLYDRLGSYEPVWWFGALLGVLAAFVHWPIREQAVDRLQPVPA
ncbi:MAG: MFS transporter [Pseudomonadota bacterium]